MYQLFCASLSEPHKKQYSNVFSVSLYTCMSPLSFSHFSIDDQLCCTCLSLLFSCTFNRVIDVGSEWRTFSNERNATDRSRVGAAEVIRGRREKKKERDGRWKRE